MSSRTIRLFPLGSRALVTVLGGILLAILVLGASKAYSLRGEQMSLLTQRAERMADFTARALLRPMFDYDYGLIAAQVEALSGDPELIQLTVEDNGVRVAGFEDGSHTALTVVRPLVFDNRKRPPRWWCARARSNCAR